jgi:hypothetical protein
MPFRLRVTTTSADSAMFAPPFCTRRWWNNAFPSASSYEDGGNPANIAASGASNHTLRDARAANNK